MTEPTRTRRSAMSFATNLLLTAVTTIVGLIATPLILRWLGEERMGAFRAGSDWLAYLGLLELGIGGSLAAAFVRVLATNNADALKRTFAAGVRAYLGVTLLAGAGGVCLLAGITRLVPLRSVPLVELLFGVAIGMSGVLFMPLSPLRSLAEADQRSYVVNLLLIGQSLLTTLTAVLLAWQGVGIAGQFAAAIVGAAFFWAALSIDASRRHPGMLAAALNLSTDRQSSLEVTAQRWPILTLRAASQVSFFTDSIIIARVIGPAAVVPFFLTQRLASLMQGQLVSVSSSSWAALAQLLALGERDTLNRRLIELTQLVSILGCAAGVAIVPFNRFFVASWVGEAQFAGTLITILGVVNAIALALLQLWCAMFTGTGLARKLVKVSCLAALINLVMSVMATRWFGLIGPLVGTSVAFAFIQFWTVPLLLRRHIGTPMPALLVAAGAPVALAVLPALCAWSLSHTLVHVAWVPLIGMMGATSALYALLAGWVLLDAPTRAAWRDRIRHVFDGVSAS